MNKDAIEILQGSAVTQTVLGYLTIYSPVANFQQCTCAKNLKSWLIVDKVIAMKTVWFFGPPRMLTCAKKSDQSSTVGYSKASSALMQ